MTSAPLTRARVKQLGSIQHFANVPSIRERGILSNQLAAGIPHRSVAMSEIQERRSKVIVPGTGRRLHTYANLYINPRNKMMYKVKYENDDGDLDICVLGVSHHVLDLPGVVITDCNASIGRAQFGPSPDALSRIIEDEVFAESWNSLDPIEKIRLGGIVCAEILVPDRVPPEYVLGAYVSCDASREALRAVVRDRSFPVTVSRRLFFR